MSRAEKPPRLPPQFEVEALGRTGSVMRAALGRAADGAGEGTLVWAREQTSARTRRGKAWIGYAGNLHCALIIEPDYPNEEAWQLVYVNALAVGSAIAEMVSPMTGLRFAWPNRLLINDLLAARLDVATTDPTRDPYPALVLGASVNVAAHPPQPEPEEYNSIHASNAARRHRRRRPRSLREPFSRLVEPLGRRGIRAAAPRVAHPGRRARLALGDPADPRSNPGPPGRRRRTRRARPRHRSGPATHHRRGVLRPGRGTCELTPGVRLRSKRPALMMRRPPIAVDVLEAARIAAPDDVWMWSMEGACLPGVSAPCRSRTPPRQSVARKKRTPG